MRKIFLFFAAASLASVVFSGCGNDNIDDESLDIETYAVNNDKITITATIVYDESTPETRVGLEDLGESGVKLTWAAGDGITMYDSNGNFAATFELDPESDGLESGTFTLVSGDITEGAQYTVVYPADEAATLDARNRSVDTAIQSGSGAMEHLSDICYMTADYIYSADNVVSFSLEYAMLTIIIASPVEGLVGDYGAPQSLTVTNGVNQNTILIDGVADMLSPFTVYMLVEPTTDADRTLTFDLVSDSENGSYTFSRSIENVSTVYEAGKRYTANLSGENVLSLGDGWRLADFSSTNYPADDTWVVLDAIDISDPVSEMYGLRDALYAVYDADNSSRISLEMPNAIGIPGVADITNPDPSNIPFFQCFALVSVSLPVATEIEPAAFAVCINLTEINLPAALTIGDLAFFYCQNLTEINLPAALTIGDSAFVLCTSLTEVNLPAALTIGQSAFQQCASLENVNIPVATEIGDYAFYQLSNLTNVTMPEVITVGFEAFLYCVSLTDIYLPEATTIGAGAFEGCTDLTAIDLPKATTLADFAFYGCTNTGYVNLPEATSIGGAALAACTTLTSIDLPKVTFIGDRAFDYCTALTELKIATASTGITSTPEFLFDGANPVINITLTIGTPESQIAGVGTNVDGDIWRGYGPFANVIVEDVQ